MDPKVDKAQRLFIKLAEKKKRKKGFTVGTGIYGGAHLASPALEEAYGRISQPTKVVQYHDFGKGKGLEPIKETFRATPWKEVGKKTTRKLKYVAPVVGAGVLIDALRNRKKK